MPARPRLTVDPRRFRLSFVAAFAVGQFLIWAGFAAQFLITRAAHIAGFEQRILADIVVLEDHVSRSLDVAAARVLLVATAAGDAEPPAPDRLRDAIADSPVIRSLSLAAADGTIVASSTRANIGARLPAGTLPPPGTYDPPRSMVFGLSLIHI